ELLPRLTFRVRKFAHAFANAGEVRVDFPEFDRLSNELSRLRRATVELLATLFQFSPEPVDGPLPPAGTLRSAERAGVAALAAPCQRGGAGGVDTRPSHIGICGQDVEVDPGGGPATSLGQAQPGHFDLFRDIFRLLVTLEECIQPRFEADQL